MTFDPNKAKQQRDVVAVGEFALQVLSVIAELVMPATGVSAREVLTILKIAMSELEKWQDDKSLTDRQVIVELQRLLAIVRSNDSTADGDLHGRFLLKR